MTSKFFRRTMAAQSHAGRTSSVPGVLQLGDDRLRRISAPIPANVLERLAGKVTGDAEDADVAVVDRVVDDVHRKLQVFRTMHGFGRAISAPQCNHHLRIVAMDLKGDADNIPVDVGAKTTFTLFNPEIVRESTGDTISLWDD